MGNHGMNFEFGPAFEDIANMFRKFGAKMSEMGPDIGASFCGNWGPGEGHQGSGQEGRGWEGFSSYFYPPVNSYISRDGSMVLEFALAGIDQSSVSISFAGDYLILSAKATPGSGGPGEGTRFHRRGFVPRDIERKKYFVPALDYVQERTKAAFKNGILTVTVPPKEPEGGGIKVDIEKEGK